MYALMLAVMGTLVLGQQSGMVHQTQLSPPQQKVSAGVTTNVQQPVQKAQTQREENPVTSVVQKQEENVPANVEPVSPTPEPDAKAPVPAKETRAKKSTSNKRIAAFWLMLPRT